ncbi:MAG: hypothetical protein R3298_02160 [Gammaproteobacteria bacterium]|nr:hypothetical protein [Gammaproteobacteria bacterium]
MYIALEGAKQIQIKESEMRTLISIAALSLALSGLAFAGEQISDREKDSRASDVSDDMKAVEAQRDKTLSRAESPDPNAVDTKRDKAMSRADYPGKEKMQPPSYDAKASGGAKDPRFANRAESPDPKADEGDRGKVMSRTQTPDPQPDEAKPGDTVSAEEGGHGQKRAGSGS